MNIIFSYIFYAFSEILLEKYSLIYLLDTLLFSTKKFIKNEK